jgi:amino acid permease
MGILVMSFHDHSCGIMLIIGRFSYVIMGADQIVTVASAIRFQYADDRTFISWATGMNTNPAIWISVFLVAVVILNMIPVKVSSDFEERGEHLPSSDIFSSVLWRI